MSRPVGLRAGGFHRRLLRTFLLSALVAILLAWPLLKEPSRANSASRNTLPVAPIGPLLGESTRFTSGFGEPRALRLHAGIDFSTNREKGMPVLSPAGGWISRLAADYTGYGLQLMVTDSLGRRHLFAHLSAFRDDLAIRLEQARQDSGRYVHVLHFATGEFPVQRGEVIGLSGDTGNGPPHLHYELRAAEEDLCFNPRRHGLRLEDRLPPRILGLALLPLEAGAMVEGGLLPMRLKPQDGGSSQWRVMDTLACRGPVALALHALERLPDNGAAPIPWQVEVVEEGDTLFRQRLDAFPLAWNDHSGRIYQRWLQHMSGDPWLRLWNRGGPLDLWSGPVDEEGWRGRLRPVNGKPLRRLQILVRDENLNLSRLDLVLRLLPASPPTAAFAPLDSMAVAELKATAAPSPKPAKARRTKGRRKNSRVPRPAPAPDPEWSRFTLADGFHVRLAPLPAHAAELRPVLVADGDTLSVWGQLRARGWEWILPPQTKGELRVANLPASPGLRLDGWWLDPGREQVWRDARQDPAVVVYSQRRTVEDFSFLSFKRGKDGRVFTLGPSDLQLEMDLELEISLSTFPEHLRDKVALFQAGAGGGPVALIGGRRDADRLKVTVGKAGSYVLHADTRGPGISLRKAPPIKVKRKGKGRRARWRTVPAEFYADNAVLVWDVGGDPSGIADVELRLAGRRFYPPYEPDTHLARFPLDQRLPAGVHDLELRVRDRLGNESVSSSRIRIQ